MLYVAAAVFLGWILGANNTASILGPAIATGVFHHRKITLIASIFVVLGALVNGHEGLRNVSSLGSAGPYDGVIVLLCAGISMLLLTRLGFPASASQTVFGGLVGVGLVRIGAESMNWHTIVKFMVSWILTPFFAAMIAFFIYHVLALWFRTIHKTHLQDLFIYAASWLAGLYDAYALGANNVANVTGPVLTHFNSIELAAFLGGLSIAFGVLTSSRRVIDTVGKQIVALDHFSSVVAMLAQATTLFTFSFIGVPVAASQAIVGGVIGAGYARGVKLSSGKTVLWMVSAWLLAPIVSGVFAASLCRIL
ncbi:inorganic phosphate transporter [Thermotoga caldifontis]|uniref:inorganic phosphate transporter n=1 Tax=Thermotoga caldifontis TaxID=1508419 RepID=UPI00059754B3|nr:inorganic phosphate transporter [Thermotoga caldifontis]